jgi:hypothetical protein
MPISRTQIILLIAFSLVLGGIAGAGITRYHFRKKQRTALSVRYLLGSKSMLEELELLDQNNIDEVKKRVDGRLALCILGAEALTQQNDKAGEIARETLRIAAVHRSSQSYIKEETSLRKIISLSGEKPQKPSP